MIGGNDFFVACFYFLRKLIIFFSGTSLVGFFAIRKKYRFYALLFFNLNHFKYGVLDDIQREQLAIEREKKRPRLTPSRLRGTYPSRSSILDHHHSRSASSPFLNTTIRSPLSKVSSSWLCASYPNTAYTTPLFMIPSFSWTPADKFKYGFQISRKKTTKTITFF